MKNLYQTLALPAIVSLSVCLNACDGASSDPESAEDTPTYTQDSGLWMLNTDKTPQ